MTQAKTTDKGGESSADKSKKIKNSENETPKEEQQPNIQAEEEDDENPFGGMRGGKNFKKNLGCGG